MEWTWLQLIPWSLGWCVLALVPAVFLLKKLKALLSNIFSAQERTYIDGVLYLHVFPRRIAKKVVNLSPYVVKLETWLRMKGMPYEVCGLTDNMINV